MVSATRCGSQPLTWVVAKPLIQLVADNVRAAREKIGWSRAELARQAGLAENTVKHLEEPGTRAPTKSGKTASPQLDVLDKLASKMGYPTWQLLTDSFDPNEPLSERPITKRDEALHEQIRNAYRRLDRSAFDGNDRT